MRALAVIAAGLLAVSSLTAARPAAEWRTVGSWSGTGDRQTEVFVVAGEPWRVSWTTRGTSPQGVLYINVFSDNEMRYALGPGGAAQMNASDNALVRLAPGRYYLDIRASNLDWTIAVEEER